MTTVQRVPSGMTVPAAAVTAGAMSRSPTRSLTWHSFSSSITDHNIGRPAHGVCVEPPIRPGCRERGQLGPDGRQAGMSGEVVMQPAAIKVAQPPLGLPQRLAGGLTVT